MRIFIAARELIRYADWIVRAEVSRAEDAAGGDGAEEESAEC